MTLRKRQAWPCPIPADQAIAAPVGLIISGTVDQSEQNILTNELIDASYAVLCLARPTSDCTIKTNVADDLSETLMPHH